jgi:hypothetical protein
MIYHNATAVPRWERSGRTNVKSRNRSGLQLASSWLLLQPMQLNARRGNSRLKYDHYQSFRPLGHPRPPPDLPRILNSAADVVPISRLCRSLMLKRREIRHIARRCGVHTSVMDEPSAAVWTSNSGLSNIWSQYPVFRCYHFNAPRSHLEVSCARRIMVKLCDPSYTCISWPVELSAALT